MLYRPMPLIRVPEPFDHPDWLFELKHDGFWGARTRRGAPMSAGVAAGARVPEVGSALRGDCTLGPGCVRGHRWRARVPRRGRPEQFLQATVPAMYISTLASL